MARTNGSGERVVLADLSESSIARARSEEVAERARRHKVVPTRDELGRWVLSLPQAAELLRLEAEAVERYDREHREQQAEQLAREAAARGKADIWDAQYHEKAAAADRERRQRAVGNAEFVS